MVSSRRKLLFAARSSEPQWSVTAVDPTITMGADAQWTITRDMRGRASTATSIYVRIMNATELAVGPGSIAGFPGDFTEAFDIQMQALADADPDVICTGGFSTIRLEFLDTWDNSFTVSRTTVNQVGRGALRCGLVIYQPAGGTIISDSAAIDIDEEVPTADEAPVCTVQPAISGSGQQGSQLTSTYGTWTGVPAVTQAMLAGQWYRGASTLIAGATSPQYTSVAADTTAGSVFFRVTANNGVGGNVIANSAPITISPVLTAPVFTSSPTFTGPNPPQVGLALIGTNGTATGNPAPTIAPTWQVAQINTSDIDLSYTPVVGDVGKKVRLRNIATNSQGSATEYSVESANVINAAGGTLTAVAFSNNFVLWMGPEDTVIGTAIGIGGPIAGLSFASGGDAGGRVKITGTAPNFVLKIGAVAPNFGTSDSIVNSSSRAPISEYTITTVANPGGIQNTHTLLARYPAIAPTGGGASPTVITTSTIAGVRAELQNNTTSPRRLNLDPAVPVVMACQTGYYGRIGSQTTFGTMKKNFDHVGHRRAIVAKDSAMQIMQAENARFYNLNFRPGADMNGSDFDNRDCMEIRYGSDLLFAYCSFAWSIDEMASVIRYTGSTGVPGFALPRRVKFYRCIWAQGLEYAGHSEANHDLGALAYAGSSQIIFDQCFFLNLRQRMPLFGMYQGMGYVLQNSIICDWTSAGGGTIFSNTRNAPLSGLKSTAIIRGNLYREPSNTADMRSKAIYLNQDIQGGSYLYVAPMNGPDANHFFSKSSANAPNMASDPLNPALIYCSGNSTRASIVSTPRFQLADDTYLPTTTTQNRQTLYNTILGRTTCLIGPREFDNGDPLTGNPVPGFLAMGQNDYEVMDSWDTRSTRPSPKPRGAYPPYTGLPLPPRDTSLINFTYKTGRPPNNT